MLMLQKRHSNIGRKKINDFIRLYEDGQVKTFELTPMHMEQSGLIMKYVISAYRHKDE